MKDLATRTDSQLILDLIQLALRVSDERLNAVAAEFLTRQGALVVHELIQIAACTRNTPGHRVRALKVLARIGQPYGVEFLDLLALLRQTRCKALQQAAKQLFGPLVFASRM